MGLIKAATGAAGGTLADQWKEFFYSDSLDNDTLMVRGKKRIDRRSSNTKGHDNVITNGSGIAVADGQCMMIVDQGKIVEVCAEPGDVFGTKCFLRQSWRRDQGDLSDDRETIYVRRRYGERSESVLF